MWSKKEAGDGLEYIIYSCGSYPCEHKIFIKEYPAGIYKVMWLAKDLRTGKRYKGCGRLHDSKNSGKNRREAEFEANMLKTRLMNENPAMLARLADVANI